jgi:hypothetical protein
MEITASTLIAASPSSRSATTSRRALMRLLRISVRRVLGVVRWRRTGRRRRRRWWELVLLIACHLDVLGVFEQRLGATRPEVKELRPVAEDDVKVLVLS